MRLAHVVAGVDRINNAELTPQSPARIYLKSNARRPLVRQLVRPRKVRAELAFGPGKEPSSYDSATPKTVEKHAINACLCNWFATARIEL